MVGRAWGSPARATAAEESSDCLDTLPRGGYGSFGLCSRGRLLLSQAERLVAGDARRDGPSLCRALAFTAPEALVHKHRALFHMCVNERTAGHHARKAHCRIQQHVD